MNAPFFVPTSNRILLMACSVSVWFCRFGTDETLDGHENHPQGRRASRIKVQTSLVHQAVTRQKGFGLGMAVTTYCQIDAKE